MHLSKNARSLIYPPPPPPPPNASYLIWLNENFYGSMKNHAGHDSFFMISALKSQLLLQTYDPVSAFSYHQLAFLNAVNINTTRPELLPRIQAAAFWAQVAQRINECNQMFWRTTHNLMSWQRRLLFDEKLCAQLARLWLCVCGIAEEKRCKCKKKTTVRFIWWKYRGKGLSKSIILL